MTSNTTGERRWASTKKGGMTVLGKVAVPKPINLPSQRLENHGLDPNVELVPKGSLSWGARSSSPASNAWGSSSTLSSKIEGGSTSPSHLSGRPSSSGGNRPSTAGSERTHDWTSKSRPSSASGILASSNTSLLALRPRSAETRPGSSHLSRFAESVPDSTVAQGASGSADQMGITTSSNEGFSMTSRDFPTLGSEKNSDSLDNNYQDRPGSSSGVPSATTVKVEGLAGDDVSWSRDVKGGMVNSRKNDGPRHVEDGRNPGMEKWHGDPYFYPNPNISPQFYENWPGGAPPNPPNGVWFRGPPGTPYGAPPMTAPGGFPTDPFPYYHPQVPAPGHVNSQMAPPYSSGPRGPPPQSGDMRRPIVDPYIRPGMPRPGYFPGYYGPPMGFWNPNEQDLAYMGVPAGPAGPPVYNRYPNQNVPEPTNSTVISCEIRTLEKVEHGSPHDSERSYSAPVEQHKGRDKKIEEKKWGHKVTANVHPRDKGDAANSSSQENLRNEDYRKDGHMNHRKLSLQREEASRVLLQGKIESKGPSSVKLHGSSSSRGDSDNVNPVIENVNSPRDHRLMKNMEGINVVQASDKRNDFHGEESQVRRHEINSKASHAKNESNTGIRLERHHPSGVLVPVATNITMLAEDTGIRSATSSVTVSRLSTHKLKTRGDNGGKGRLNRQEADGWQEKGATSASPSMVLVVNSERTTDIQGQQQPIAMQSTEMPLLDGEMMDGDCDSQRAKMREIAKQRALKLQKEEEERIKEQKAKAFAKLEELNRRTASQSKEDIDKAENAPYHAEVLQKQEQSNIKIELRFGSIQPGEMGCNLSKASEAVGSNPSSGVLCLQKNQGMHQDDPVLAQKHRLPATDDTCIDDFAGSHNAQVGQIVGQKRAGHKQEYNVRSGKNLHEKPILEPKDKSNAVVTLLKEAGGKGISSPESNIPMDLPIATDSLMQLKKKNTRAGKKKHKVDESVAVSSASIQKEFDASKSVTESIKAPVKSQNKVDATDANDPKAEEAGLSAWSVNAVPSSSKSKRAEMERYVPKPAIKEPAQQGSSQLSASSSTDQSIPDISGREHASSQTIERTGMRVESSHVSGYKSAAKPVPQFAKVQSVKQDEKPAKQHSQQPGETNQDNVDDGWNIVDEPVSSGIVSNAKDHGAFGRGKRNSFKEQRGSRKPHNFDHKNHSNAGAYADYSETYQEDRPDSSQGKNTAQWQPKPQTRVTNQQGNNASGQQTVTVDQGTASSTVHPSAHSALESERMGKQESLVERRAAPSKDRTNSSNKGIVVEVESAPPRHTGGTNTEQRPSSSGHRKNGTYNGRFSRGHNDFRGDPSFTAHGNRQNHAPTNRDKQRQNSHYEYRPVGPDNSNKRGNNSEAQSVNQHAGPKFRDQGPGSHSRHGEAGFSEQ